MMLVKSVINRARRKIVIQSLRVDYKAPEGSSMTLDSAMIKDLESLIHVLGFTSESDKV